jgi:predicted deacylase
MIAALLDASEVTGRDITDRLPADLAAANFTGTVQIVQAVLAALATEPDVGWQGVLARVEDALVRQAHG